MIDNIGVGIPSGGSDLSFIPHDFSFNRTARQPCIDSRTPSSITRNRFFPYSLTPITTRAHNQACSDRSAGQTGVTMAGIGVHDSGTGVHDQRNTQYVRKL